MHLGIPCRDGTPGFPNGTTNGAAWYPLTGIKNDFSDNVTFVVIYIHNDIILIVIHIHYGITLVVMHIHNGITLLVIHVHNDITFVVIQIPK